MHILIIPSWYPRAVDDVNGSFFREQAIALAKRNCKVGVISLQLCLLQNLLSGLFISRKIWSEIDEGVNTYRKNGVKWFPFMPRAAAVYWRYFGLRLFDEYVKNHGEPDVIHVQSMVNAGVVAEAIHQRTGIPYVITEHASAFARGLVPKARLNILKSGARTAYARFAVSNSFASLLQSQFGNEIGRWKVMPNIVNDSFLSYPLRNCEKVDFSFICVSMLARNKNVDLIILAFCKAFGGKSSFRLYLGGDGEERISLELLAGRLGVSEQVIFLGMLTREQVVKYVAEADAFVIGSSYETFGVAVVEALALGKPVVATYCGGPDDIVLEDDGILVPANDPDAMVSAMLAVYENIRSYDPETIREGCRTRFSEQVVIGRMMTVYREILSAKNLVS